MRLTFSRLDAGRTFDLLINDRLIQTIVLGKDAAQEMYTLDYTLPAELVSASGGKLVVKFVARSGSVAGGVYGVRLLR